MNSDELRQRQLARLRGELIDPPIAESALEFVTDPELDAAYARYCEDQKYWEREVKPRELWERERRELMQQINIQPESEAEPEPFVVGHRRNDYGELVALPAPKWPNPGEPKTPEISRAHFKEELLLDDANRSLNDCVRWLAAKLRDPESWEHEFSGPPSKLYDTAWSFLMGTWRGRCIEPPTDNEMMQWVREYNVALKNRRAKGVACKEDSKSLSD